MREAMRSVTILILTGFVLLGCGGPGEPISTPTVEPTPVPTETLLPTEKPLPSTPTPLPPPGQPVATGTAGLPWWNDRVFYEVFVRSFYDSDGDGTGDIPGLIAKLDYLNDGDPSTNTDLGVSGIWLMPVAESPSYHGYDVADYYTIEDSYGTNEDFHRLIAEAHERGIVVIVDLVMNHTSTEHPWFVDARRPGSEHEDWYVWEWEKPSYLGPWGQDVWYEAGGRYYYAAFWEGMPDLNYLNGEVTLAIYDVIRFWLEDMNVDGFRLDAIKHLIEDGSIQENTPETHAWLVGFHRYVHTVSPDALTVGEVWSSTEEVSTYIGDRVDIAFEFDLAEAILSGVRNARRDPLDQAQARILESYPQGQYAAFLTNHDQNRVMSQFADSVDAAKVAATLLLTNPGVPFLYYGEEIGMTGEKPDERIRTPMQWDSTEGGGFTTGRPWEELSMDYEEYAVALQTDDPASLLSHYRSLIQLRQAHPALRAGDFWTVQSDTKKVYSFLRHSDGDTLLVLVNLFWEEIGEYHLALPEGPLATVSGVALLLGGGEPAVPSLNAAGGFDAYTPLPALPPRSSVVIQFVP